MSEQLLLFSIADRSFALAVRYVREVVRAVALSPPAVASPRIEGLLDLRGSTIKVVDLHQWLNMPRSEIQLGHRLIIIDVDDHAVALRAESDPVFQDVATGSIETQEAESLTPQVVHLEGRLAHLIDPHRLVAFVTDRASTGPLSQEPTA